MSGLKEKLIRNIINSIGWKTNRKIIVIESDDWGSIRSNKKAYQNLKKKVNGLEKDSFSRYDSLASTEDLNALFEMLSKFKDINNRPPILTFNTVVANPDFDKIKEKKFDEYFYEPFTETLKKEYHNQDVFKLWEEGINNNLIRPQFHCREHLNVSSWLSDLKSGKKDINLAFEEKIFGLSVMDQSLRRGNYMATLDYSNQNELQFTKNSIEDGVKIFESLFGFKSLTTIAPCYVWSDFHNAVFAKHDIKGLQGINIQYVPSLVNNNYSKKYHYTGQKNKNNQVHLVRNAFWEPTSFKNKNNEKDLLDRIDNAFFWKKPVIIGSHRINYIGSIVEKNRTENLKMLNNVLVETLRRYEDVEFMSSDELLNLIITND
jgi:hypothetical protein